MTFKLKKQPLPDHFPEALWSPKRSQRPRRNPLDWAMCGSTLFPLVPEKKVHQGYQGYLPFWVPYFAWLLYAQRAQQLEALRQAGSRQIPQLQCCAPSYVDTLRPVRFTCRSIWCPFCWGRLVTKVTYQRFQAVPKAAYNSHRLAEVRSYEYLARDLEFDQLRHLVQSAAVRTLAQLHFPEDPGMFKLTTLEPSNSGWKITVRALAFVHQRFAKRNPPPASPEREVVYHKTRGHTNELAKLVGRVCEYPFELLFQPAVDVQQALRLRDGLRLMSSTGVLRGN